MPNLTHPLWFQVSGFKIDLWSSHLTFGMLKRAYHCSHLIGDFIHHSSLLTSHLSLLYSTRMQLVVPIAVSAAVRIDTITCITVFQVSFFIISHFSLFTIHYSLFTSVAPLQAHTL